MRGWYDVKNYGATGDGTTDDTSGIDAAIAAINTAGGGVLFFPPGTYKVTAALTTLTVGCTVVGCGQGVWGWVEGLDDAVSTITSTSATAKLFTSSAQSFRMEGLALVNTATATAGSAVHGHGTADYHMQMVIRDCLFKGWYDSIDSQVTGSTVIESVNIYEPVRYGIRIRNTEETDSGALHLSMCYIGGNAVKTGSGVRIESSGGHKIVGLTTGGMVRGIDLSAAADTSILLISASSFENYTGTGIYLHANSFAYTLVSIQGCQFGQYGNGSGNAIYMNGIDDVTIAGGLFRANTGTPTAISLNNGTRGYIGPMVGNGFSTLVATSSFTSLDNDSAGA